MNQHQLKTLRSIGAYPLYLTMIMASLGLVGSGKIGTAEYIASAAGWDKRRTATVLSQLSVLGIVHRVNARAWCLNPESTQNVLSAVVVVVNNNIESLITTTTAESTQNVLSAPDLEYDGVVKRLQSLGVGLEKSKQAVNSAAKRGETPKEIESYIDKWVIHKSSTAGRGIFNLGGLIAKRLAEGTAAPDAAIATGDLSGYDGYLWAEDEQ